MNVRGVALFFAGWSVLSVVACVIPGKLLGRSGRHYPPVPPPRAAVEPATDVSPSQAPATFDGTQLVAEFFRHINEAKARYHSASEIRRLETMWAHPAWGTTDDTDPTPPHGLPRP